MQGCDCCDIDYLRCELTPDSTLPQHSQAYPSVCSSCCIEVDDSYVKAEGFCEDLLDVSIVLNSYVAKISGHPHFGREEKMTVRLQCHMPKQIVPPVDENVICQLQALLQAHQAALSQQTRSLSAPLDGLTQTFDVLLEKVREMRGIIVHTVRLLKQNLRTEEQVGSTSSEISPKQNDLPYQLQAHEACLASLATLHLDPSSLLATFKPLLKTLSDMQSVIDPPTPRVVTLNASMGSTWIKVLPEDPPQQIIPVLINGWRSDDSIINGKHQLPNSDLRAIPEDLRRLKNQLKILVVSSLCIKEVPSWLNEFHLLETLDLGTTMGTRGSNGLPGIDGTVENHYPMIQTLPVLSGLVNLKVLKLRLPLLKSLPDTIGEDLGSLTSLHLTECYDLKKLPSLPLSLTTLHLRHVSEEAPDGSGEEFPSCIRTLTSLTDLEIVSGTYQRVPEWISMLVGLKKLHLAGTKHGDFGVSQISFLPNTFGNLTALQCLTLVYHKLTRLPDTFTNLTSLKFLALCLHTIQMLPSFEPLTLLQELAIFYCVELQELPIMWHSLQKLTLDGHHKINQPAAHVGRLSSLRELMLDSKVLPSNFKDLTSLCKLKLIFDYEDRDIAQHKRSCNSISAFRISFTRKKHRTRMTF